MLFSFLSNRYHVNTTLFTHQASTGYNPFEGIFALADATSTFSTYPDFNLSSHHNAISRDRPNAKLSPTLPRRTPYQTSVQN